jgi:hypothetical protein
MNNAKPIWQSKTFWVQLLTILVSIAAFVEGQEWIQDNPTMVAIIGVVVGVLNIVIRSITRVPVVWRKPARRSRI